MREHRPPQTTVSKTHEGRFGSCLEHGEAHAEDHARYSRRDFLARMGLATAGVAFSLGGVPLNAYGRAPMLRQLGLRPLGVGLAAALAVGATSIAFIYLLAPWMTSTISIR